MGAQARRILVVDDSEDLRELARLALERQGWEVLSAGTGEEALAMAERERPDAILLDLVLPDMGGLEAARALKGRPATAGIPIVVCSGRKPPGIEEHPDLAGFILKPWDPVDLGPRVRRLLGWDPA